MRMPERVMDRQIATVLNLAIPPQPYYEMRSYRVDRGAANHLEVTRSYSQPGFKTEWHECLFVGPRGGTKRIFRSFY
jgi:hypothetical protein